MEKLIYTNVELIEENDESTGVFFDLKVTQIEETYDEKTKQINPRYLLQSDKGVILLLLTPSIQPFRTSSFSNYYRL